MAVYLVNKTDRVINENKPGIGVFVVQPGESIEVKDCYDEAELPNKTKHKYLKNTAREIADSVVKDFLIGGLEVIESDAKPEPLFAKAVVKEPKREEEKKVEEKKETKKEEEKK